MTAPAAPAAPAFAATEAPAYRLYVLAMLFLVYAFNFVDRILVGILAPLIKRDLGVTDAQIGLMSGTAFALLYTTLAIPIAALSDRGSRTTIIAVSLAVWSGFTALSGAAAGFMGLFLARIGVGVGEAGGGPPSYSLIADYFPPGQRGRAYAVYAFGVPLGIAAGLILGGVLASVVDWRMAFFVVGVAGVLLAPIFKMTVREPQRARFDAAAAAPATGLRQVVAALRSKPSFWLLAFGGAFASLFSFGLFFWIPSVLMRSFEMSLRDASLAFGAAMILGGAPGVWVGGLIGDRFAHANRSFYGLIPAAGYGLAIPAMVLALHTPSRELGFLLLVAVLFVGFLANAPTMTALQNLAPPNMRATATAIFLFINTSIAMGIGTPLLGGLADLLSVHHPRDGLRLALTASTAAYALAALFLVLAAKRLDRDWID